MDDNEAGGGGYGEQFHRNEAISAVADEGFLGEEDDEYEDLYNDVNVGENFLHSLQKNEDNAGQRDKEPETSKVTPPPPLPNLAQPQPVPESGSGAVQVGGSSKAPSIVDGYQNTGFRLNNNTNEIRAGREMTSPGGGGQPGQLSVKAMELEEHTVSNIIPSIQPVVNHQQPHPSNIGNVGNAQNVNGTGGNVYGSGSGGVGGGGGGGTILFVGDLHWWTTDAELEAELSKYGRVKEVKFFDEKASGKSKGYCQVEFYDPGSATACKEGMNGYMFNGRPCVVAYASPFTVKRMGEAQLNRNQQNIQSAVNQPRRAPGDLAGKPGGGGNSNIATSGNQGSADGNRGFGRGNWGRGNAQGGMGGRGPMGPMRNRAAGMGGRGFMGNNNGFGQGIGVTPPLMHPQTMMGQGFDPAFGGPMGRMGSYGGFPGVPNAPFSGMMSSFNPVGNVGLPGVAPHVNPAFFGRGMPMNGGMGMMPAPGIEGANMGMWSDPNMGGWAGEGHGGRGESSYGEEAASDHQYKEGSHDRGPWPNATEEKDKGSEREWSGSSDRRYREDKEAGYDRDMPREKDMGPNHSWSERGHSGDRERQRQRGRSRDHEHDRERERERERERDRGRHRDERERYADHHRYRDREPEYDDEWDRGRSSRTRTKSRLSHEEEQRSRSRDADYGKRRRLTSD